jgi:hypothetical protein
LQDQSGEETARSLAARREKVQGVCAVCGKPFVGLRTRKYCSQTCNVAAYRARHRAEFKAWQRDYYRRKKEQRHQEPGRGGPEGEAP